MSWFLPRHKQLERSHAACSSALSSRTAAKPSVFLAAVVCLLGAPLGASAQKEVTFENNVGIPTGTATTAKPLVIELQVKDPANPGQTRKQQVNVEVEAIKPGESPKDASIRKAKAIADAVNKLLPGSATAGQKKMVANVWNPIKKKWEQVTDTRGTIKIKNLAVDPKKPNEPVIKMIPPDPTNQPHNGGNIQGQAPSGGGGGSSTTPTYKGSMKGTGSTSTGMDGLSTLADPIPSIVSFGYYRSGNTAGDMMPWYIATVNPFPGESDSDVLTDLAGQLSAMGVASHYDSGLNELFLDQELSPEYSLFWGSSDTGSAYQWSVTATVPEASSIALFLAGGAGLGLLRIRRRH